MFIGNSVSPPAEQVKTDKEWILSRTIDASAEMELVTRPSLKNGQLKKMSSMRTFVVG